MRNALIAILILTCLIFVYRAEAQEKEQQKMLAPKKIEVDANYDGKADRFEYYNAKGEILKVEGDSDGDGKMDEWISYKNGQPLKSEKDTNGDGKPDVWIEY
tara:strand:- start:480 stop:785 length:306 start_codon:yes stop_codon:yes gene_type:complete